jgi:hypothetical protein
LFLSSTTGLTAVSHPLLGCVEHDEKFNQTPGTVVKVVSIDRAPTKKTLQKRRQI